MKNPLLSSACVLGLAAMLATPLVAQPADNDNRSRQGVQRGAARDSEHRRDQQNASKLIGMTVKNGQNEKVGTVEDLLVDLDSGRILGVVISSDGVKGVRNETDTVSPQSLTRGSGGKELRIDLSREQLSWAPRMKRDAQATGEREETGAASVFRRGRDADGQNARADAEHRDADNTARNVRDRDGDTNVVPLDQGNKRADIETTARIRSAVVNRDGLSTTAKNVKIVTRDGQVTLRGPVATEEEKRVIADIAARAAPDGRVSNQLEVASR